MLSRKEFDEKKKYIIERLKGKNSPLDEEKLKTSLIALIFIESENEKLKNVRLYNAVNALSKGKLTLTREKKFRTIYPQIEDIFKTTIDDDYLSFLIQLAQNVSEMQIDYGEDKDELKPLEMSDEKVVDLSKIFYSQIENEEIRAKAQKIISDPTHFGFTSAFTEDQELTYGLTAYDTVFKKPYITSRRLGNAMTCQAFNHEVMHGIDFYSHPDITNSQMFYGFHETPTYTIDYLYHDFMESMGFDKGQVDALRRKKLQYAQVLAKECIVDRLKANLGFKKAANPTIQDIREVVMNRGMLKDMLELQSCVIAHGLYQQMQVNKGKGLANLQTLMSTPLSPDKTPDFSFIGLDKQMLLQVSKSMGMIGHNTLQMNGQQVQQSAPSQSTEMSQGRSR